ncbi:hypothetical protein F4694_003706 [Bacillus niacini]|uniref:Uncharacterized protein n=1 Tax=Neobacillus niacini TaxID=86668 RepID=A0A852TGR0_9BACI|nr:hypothetical protein [Neobacillus niacini]
MTFGKSTQEEWLNNFLWRLKQWIYKDCKDNNITVGEIVNIPDGRVFNFADNEENYFAVTEIK